MKRLVHTRGILFVGLLSILALLNGTLLVHTFLPVRRMWEHTQWTQHNVQRYTADLQWSSGSSSGAARVHVHGRRVIGGTDLATGQPLTQNSLALVGRFASVDELYGLIDRLDRPTSHWRSQLWQYAPWLATHVDRCFTPGVQVQYDPILHHPTRVRWYAGRCYPGLNLAVTIARVQPLADPMGH